MGNCGCVPVTLLVLSSLILTIEVVGRRVPSTRCQRWECPCAGGRRRSPRDTSSMTDNLDLYNSNCDRTAARNLLNTIYETPGVQIYRGKRLLTETSLQGHSFTTELLQKLVSFYLLKVKVVKKL